MFKYSEKLRNDTIDYFKETHGKLIDHEEAEMYLESLSNLCSALINLKD